MGGVVGEPMLSRICVNELTRVPHGEQLLRVLTVLFPTHRLRRGELELEGRLAETLDKTIPTETLRLGFADILEK